MVTATDSLAAYEHLTERRSRFLRIDELCARGAQEFPALLPSNQALEEEARRAQRDIQGLERAQGALLAGVLADPAAGAHLCHAMLLPHPKFFTYSGSRGDISAVVRR